jgi:hypothetical protein
MFHDIKAYYDLQLSKDRYWFWVLFATLLGFPINVCFLNITSDFLVIFDGQFASVNIKKINALIVHSIHTMALQPKSDLGFLSWGSITIMFYGVRLLASQATPVNFGDLWFSVGVYSPSRMSQF